MVQEEIKYCFEIENDILNIDITEPQTEGSYGIGDGLGPFFVDEDYNLFGWEILAGKKGLQKLAEYKQKYTREQIYDLIRPYDNKEWEEDIKLELEKRNKIEDFKRREKILFDAFIDYEPDF